MYQHLWSPLRASCLEDSRASFAYLELGSFQTLWRKAIDLARASVTIFGAANSTRIISWGIDDFAPINQEIIDTRGLSIHFHCSELSDLLD